MPSTYKTPGVYVKEISTLPASIVAVETAIPAFVGYTQLHDTHPDVVLADPTQAAGSHFPTEAARIRSMNEYEAYFGGPNPESYSITINDEYNALDELIDRQVTLNSPSSFSSFKMYYALQMYFANGGGPCYIVSAGNYGHGGPTEAKLELALDVLRKEDEPTLLVFPDYLTSSEYGTLIQQALLQCADLQDRFTIIDLRGDYGAGVTPSSFSTYISTNLRTPVGNNHLQYGAAYFPNLVTTLHYGYDEDAVTITQDHTGGTGGVTDDLDGDALSDLYGNDETNQLYFDLKAQIEAIKVHLPPSGAIAGIYASVDDARGVWKAPANVSLSYVTGPEYELTEAENGELNVDSGTGKSINAIRAFRGQGTLVWGARTLAGNDNEWRYVPVRRLFIMAEESIRNATEFVVFEPNDANTWLKVKSMIENFLTGLWRAGALAGARPQDAYFVNVGLGTTMTAQDILEGRLIIEIGMAAVRPAEFIILRFTHKIQGS